MQSHAQVSLIFCLVFVVVHCCKSPFYCLLSCPVSPLCRVSRASGSEPRAALFMYHCVFTPHVHVLYMCMCLCFMYIPLCFMYIPLCVHVHVLYMCICVCVSCIIIPLCLMYIPLCFMYNYTTVCSRSMCMCCTCARVSVCVGDQENPPRRNESRDVE